MHLSSNHSRQITRLFDRYAIIETFDSNLKKQTLPEQDNFKRRVVCLHISVVRLYFVGNGLLRSRRHLHYYSRWLSHSRGKPVSRAQWVESPIHIFFIWDEIRSCDTTQCYRANWFNRVIVIFINTWTLNLKTNRTFSLLIFINNIVFFAFL